MVDKGALQRNTNKRKICSTDPYDGHGATKDELQENWERAVKAVRKQDNEARENKTASQRIRELQERIQANSSRNEPEDKRTERNEKQEASARRCYISKALDDQKKWAKQKQEKDKEADTTLKETIGVSKGERVMPEEAMHHDMRTGTTQEGQVWIWCDSCGAHSQERISNLARECKGRKNTAQKRRLNEGRHPTSNKRLRMETGAMHWHQVEAVRLLAQVVARSQEASDDAEEESKARANFGNAWAEWSRQTVDAIDDDVVCGECLPPEEWGFWGGFF